LGKALTALAVVALAVAAVALAANKALVLRFQMLQTAAQVGHTAVVVEVQTLPLVTVAHTTEEWVESVLFASSILFLVLLAHSHQQIQETCNGTLYSH
jgi:hypothetical protein